MKKRLIYHSIWKHLQKKQITLLQGARQTGKTTLLKQIQQDLVKKKVRTSFLSLEDKSLLTSLNQRSQNLFYFIPPLTPDKRHYIFIDKIQYLKDPSNFLKLLYDLYHNKIKLIVSGSSDFYIDKKFKDSLAIRKKNIKDSLASREKIFNLSTMGFKEFLFFKGYENYIDYVHSDFLPKSDLTDLHNLLAEYLLYGGYPDVVMEPTLEGKQEILKEIANSCVKKDAIEAFIQYPNAYMNILEIISDQICSLPIFNTISKTLKIKSETVATYVHIMQKSFHISFINPFYKSAITELRKMKKVYFQDLGLRNYFANNFNPIMVREDRRNLLENYVFRLFADQYDDWDIKYWRTQKKQEIDFIIQEKRAYEVKFSKDLYKSYKYRFFQNEYPKIPLELIHFDNVLEFKPGNNE